MDVEGPADPKCRREQIKDVMVYPLVSNAAAARQERCDVDVDVRCHTHGCGGDPDRRVTSAVLVTLSRGRVSVKSDWRSEKCDPTPRGASWPAWMTD
jgi:hypothetical protein